MSLTNSRQGFLGSRLGLAATIFSLLASSSCSCAKDAEPASPSFAAHETTWAIHVFATSEGKMGRFDFGPTPASYLNTKQARSGLAKKAYVDGPDGGTLMSGDLGDASSVQAWGLLAGAIAQCSQLDDMVLPPWSTTDSWFVFSMPPQNCAELLQREETLLCAADKLKQVADAVGQITWSAGPTALPAPLPALPWKIPPQASKDRFIARDLAMHVLAHVARLDSSMPGSVASPGDKTCTGHYLEAIDSPAVGEAKSSLIFGADATPPPPKPFPAYPPSKLDLSLTNIPKVAQDSLGFEAHILRASGRMLHDLIRDSVYADLAGAEQRSAQAMDPLNGAKIAWGVADAENGAYNSLAHVSKVLTGRVELGAVVRDPMCGGQSALAALTTIYRNELENRTGDLPISTNEQATAATLVAGTGIVLDEATIAASDGPQLASFVKQQMIESHAYRNFGAGTAPMGDIGVMLAKSIDAMRTEDMKFAFRRNARSFALATNGDSASPTTTPALSAGAYKSPTLPSGALVIANGIDRARVAGDAVARLAGVIDNTQCDEVPKPGAMPLDMALSVGHPVFASPLDWDPPAPPAAPSPWAPHRYRYVEFQDVFSVGQLFERRLTAMNAELDARALASTVPQRVAREGIAELQSWAGPGRVFVTSTDPATASYATHIQLKLAGFRRQDFGFDPLNPAVGATWDNLGLVYGPPWVAECAANLRADCPADFEADYVAHPSSAAVDHESLPLRRNYGYDGVFATLDFYVPSPVRKFQPVFQGASTPSEHLYLIARKDPHKSGVGMVLATLALRKGGGGTSAVVSTMQRELLNGAFGPHTSKDAAPEVAASTPVTGPDYCIDGVPRDVFVPLENELTSDGDQYESSWKHYLTLAKQAAERADMLGEKLISLGEQKDFRREGAGEELAEICGDVTALEKVSVDTHGALVTKEDDATLSSCIGEKKTDIVFLSATPAGVTTPGEAEAYARTKLCGPSGTHPICGSPSFSVAFLGLVDAPSTPPPGDLCANALSARASLRTGFDPTLLANAVAEPFATQAKATGTAASARISVRTDGEWTVSTGGLGLMSSVKDSGLWPGCLRSDSSAACDWSKPEVVGLNNLFRNCAPVAKKAPTDPAKASRIPALGSCGDTGAGGQGEDWAQELALIRWRIEGALWFLGASTGQVPAGMFQAPVPVADFSLGGWGSAQPYVLTAFNPTFKSTPTGSGGGKILEGTGLEAGDREAVPLKDIDRRFGAYGPVGPLFGATDIDRELPYWYGAIYQTSLLLGGNTQYLHTFGSNPAFKSDFGTLERFLSWHGAPKGEARNIWQGLAVGMGGMSCGALGGGPASSSAWPAEELVGAVGAVKANVWTRHLAGSVQARGMAFDDDAKKFYVAIRYEEDGEVKTRFDATFLSGGTPACRREPLLGPAYPGVLTATTYKTGDRLPLFVNSVPPCTSCGAAATLVQAVGLACLAESYTGGPPVTEAPAINGPEDFRVLAAWAQAQGSNAESQLSEMYLEQIPNRLLADYASDKVSGGKKGLFGGKLSEISIQIDALRDARRAAARAVKTAATAIDAANNDIERADLIKERENQDNAIRFFGMVASAMETAARISDLSKGIASFGAHTGTEAVALGAIVRQMTILKDQSSTLEKIRQNELRAVLLRLNSQIYDQFVAIQDQLSNARKAINGIQKASAELDILQSKARRKAAVAAGADYYLGPDDKPVTLPVNTVLRRQYLATQKRYEQALREAKYLAFMARRAIEQRLGVPLKDMKVAVGPLEPPAKWADDVCRLTGIDYEKLRTAVGLPDAGPGGPTDDDIVTEFADAYILDYVTKLGNLVEYYNIEFPSHDGDDTAVLSLKEDLLPGGLCIGNAPNLLTYSGQLDATRSLRVPDLSLPEPQWQVHPCESSTKCLRSVSGDALTSPSTPPVEALRGQATWLVDYDPSAAPISGDAGVDAGDSGVDGGVSDSADAATEVDAAALASAPKNMVSQEVLLEPGAYVLSWWDQARTAAGKVTNAALGAYRVAVYSPGWSSITSFNGKPHEPTLDGAGSPIESTLWGERRILAFTIETRAIYHVGFAASLPGSPGSSVAIANVQLEVAPAGGAASPYIPTERTREIVTSNCKGRSSADLRASFRRACSGPTCWYELVPNLVIDTAKLSEPGAPLAGKIARGNFNFRHITVGLNIVGTGVRTCAAGSASGCYATGFTEYTLQHDALHAGILDWDRTVRYFSFGVAPIEHGKALSAERYITLPIGSADQSLLAQPGIEKGEFRGRPLDGVYRLKIWDEPALHWDRVDDVQFILKYRYWSRIDKNAKK